MLLLPALFALTLWQGSDDVTAMLALADANRLLNAGKFKEAKPAYERYTKLNPYLGSQWWNLAQCELGLGELDAAAEHFQRAALSFSTPAACFFNAARSYAKQQKKAETLAMLRKAREVRWNALMDA